MDCDKKKSVSVFSFCVVFIFEDFSADKHALNPIMILIEGFFFFFFGSTKTVNRHGPFMPYVFDVAILPEI